MRNNLSASQYIVLGEVLFAAMNPQASTPSAYANEIGKLLKALDTCGFEHALAAARPMANEEVFPDHRGHVGLLSVRHFKAAVTAVYNVLYNDAEKRSTIELRKSDVSAKLRALGDKTPLSVSQRHLQDETIRCIECEAYRAGAVMAWGLAYDCIRSWMWNDLERRTAFNAVLMAKMGRNGPLYPNGITEYDEFYSVRPALGERDVLDALRDAALLPRVYERLVHFLSERNRYAHANSLVPSCDQTNRYVDDLMDVITQAPFN